MGCEVPHVCVMGSIRGDFGLISMAERRGRMSRNEWKDICSRRLGIVNVNADLDVLFAGADG